MSEVDGKLRHRKEWSVMPTVAEQDQALYRDWLQANQPAPDMPAEATLEQFLHDTTSTPTLRARRRRNIQPRTSERQQRPIRPDQVTAARALTQIQTHQYPTGLHGRRDAWLITTHLILGFTRRQATRLRVADVSFSQLPVRVRPVFRPVTSVLSAESPVTLSDTLVGALSAPLSAEISILGVPVPYTTDPACCPSCAVTRWLRVITPATNGWRSEVRALLNEPDDERHDCGKPLDNSWQTVRTLLPAIDRHGWVAARGPMTLRAVTATVTGRLRPADVPVRWVGVVRRPVVGRFAEAGLPELADAFDEVDAQLSALLERSAALLRVSGGVPVS